MRKYSDEFIEDLKNLYSESHFTLAEIHAAYNGEISLYLIRRWVQPRIDAGMDAPEGLGLTPEQLAELNRKPGRPRIKPPQVKEPGEPKPRGAKPIPLTEEDKSIGEEYWRAGISQANLAAKYGKTRQQIRTILAKSRQAGEGKSE